MKSLTLVTGNAGKLAEWQRLMPATYDLESVDIDLPEIQSLDLQEIVRDKVQRAYEVVGKPVVVEDVSAGLAKLGGLPGPFIKFFVRQLGRDTLFQLAEAAGDAATVQCAAAYYDGSTLVTVLGQTEGTVVEVRGDGGFGFDGCFMPVGETQTYSEMPATQKDTVGHRGKAVRLLVAELEKL